jgi:general secretion pathway protein G
MNARIILLAIPFSLLLACSSQKKQEKILWEDLVTMRVSCDQYLQEHGRRLASLQDLITDGYLRDIPADPITGRADTWRLTISRNPKNPDAPPEILDIHSGSQKRGSNGRKYNEW